jgi:asparagine synthase (glutamine-hydrolysing)
MWLLAAGPRAAEDGEAMERMAATLRGTGGTARSWRSADRRAGAASLAPAFVPEDAFDVQPLVSGERVFVCQARIDNRAEVEGQLGIEDASTVADSSLLAAAYDRWGADCVHRVVGDFSFAAWHREDGRIVAALDHQGVRRIFWTRIGEGFALSSQLPALLAHPKVSHEPDLQSMATLFDAGIDRSSTPFLAVRAVPGGHVATFRGNDVRLDRWWKPESRPTIWYRDHSEYVADLQEHFVRATAPLLRSRGPVSTTLSGGLDSGSVTAMAARLLAPTGSRLTAYTSVPEAGLVPSERPNWEADDSSYAAAVAAQHDNVDHRLVRPGGRCVPDVAPLIHARSRTPTRAATNLLWLDRISSLAAASGSRVLLTGQLGNAAFSWRGDGTVWELLMHGRLRLALAQVAIEARGRDESRARIALQALRYGWTTSRRRQRSTIDSQLTGLRYLRDPAAARARGNEYAMPPRTRAYWRAFVTTPRNVWAPEPVLQWGIEWRDPTADRRLLERLLQYPQAAFRAGGRYRGLARSLDLLPDRVRLRHTQGAQVPEAPSLIAAHADRYEDALALIGRSAGCRELFDLAALRRGLAEFRAGSRDFYRAGTFDRAIDVGLFLARLELGGWSDAEAGA